MSQPLPARPPSEQRITMEGRKLARLVTRADALIAKATEERDEALAQLLAMHAAAEARFGITVPKDGLLLDVLELIDVEDDDRWVWRGTRNNKNLPTFKPTANSEKSAVRYLAIEFGIIAETDEGMLFPTVDTDDVNPWHRELRPCPRPVGNRYRFGTIERPDS